MSEFTLGGYMQKHERAAAFVRRCFIRRFLLRVAGGNGENAGEN